MTRAKDEDGQAIVEFVLILPIFLGLIFVAIGFGITLNNYLRVTDIARVAARAAAVARFSGQSDPCKAAVAAATAAAGGLTFTPGSPTCVPNCPNNPQCNPGDPITVSVTVQSKNALTSIPFLSLALPATLTSDATVLLQ
jgi:Flp pilus assembly protein TadG